MLELPLHPETKTPFGFRGYIFSRPVRGELPPQRVQNLVIRDYLARKKLPFVLSATEYSFKNSFMMLKALIDEAHQFQGMVFYSTHHLPPASMREDLYTLVRERNFQLHFALEEIVLKRKEDIESLEDILMVRELTSLDQNTLAATPLLEGI